MREQINKVKNWKQLLNEDTNNQYTVLIRSKIYKTFRMDVTYKDGIIFKVESQGDFAEKMNNKDFLNLITNVTIKSKIDYDKLRLLLSKLLKIDILGILSKKIKLNTGTIKAKEKISNKVTIKITRKIINIFLISFLL